MSSDSGPNATLTARVTSDTSLSNDCGLLPPDDTTDRELAMFPDTTCHMDLSEMTGVVDGQSGDGIPEELAGPEENLDHGEDCAEPESLGLEELSGETIISYSSSSVEDSPEHLENPVGADEDVFDEQGEQAKDRAVEPEELE